MKAFEHLFFSLPALVESSASQLLKNPSDEKLPDEIHINYLIRNY